jgi:hypothetical protein
MVYLLNFWIFSVENGSTWISSIKSYISFYICRFFLPSSYKYSLPNGVVYFPNKFSWDNSSDLIVSTSTWELSSCLELSPKVPSSKYLDPFKVCLICYTLSFFIIFRERCGSIVNCYLSSCSTFMKLGKCWVLWRFGL